jgi:hypothetical protein
MAGTCLLCAISMLICLMRNKNIFFGISRWICVLLLAVASNAYAKHDLEARVEIGVNLLPSVIAANTRWSLEKEDEKHSIKIFIVYDENRKVARDALSKLNRIKRIRGHLVEKQIISMREIFSGTSDKNSVLFIVEPLLEYTKKAIEFSRINQFILFSPFYGDVEKGVMTGFEVTNKVLPAVNINALKDANIRLKAFFLRIAVSYD